MRQLPAAILACALAAHALTATARNSAPAAANPARPSAEEMRKLVDASMGAMIGRMTEVMVETRLRIAGKPETAEKIAKFKKNIYDSILKGSFTQELAKEIMVSTPMPSAIVMRK